jgi:hypothetical protein
LSVYLHRDDCGEDSDLALCVDKQSELKLKESRKHAGLTSRSQISGSSTRGFHFAGNLGISRSASRRDLTQTTTLADMVACTVASHHAL